MPFNPDDYRNTSSRNLAGGCNDCENDLREELTFTPEVIYFAYLLPDQTSQPQPFTITNTGTLPVGIASITVSGDFELTGDLPTGLNPGESAEVSIVFKPTLEGARIGDVTIDAGTSGPQECVHVIGIGGNDQIAEDFAALQAGLAAAVAVNNQQAAQIADLQDLLSGYVKETPVYMWRAYANSPDGRTDFTTGAPGNRSYIGLAFNKFTQDASENPEDYEWSELGITIGNVISYDTTNVGGVPSVQLITDLNDLSLQLLAYQFDRQQLRDYVDALLYVDGQPINAEIVSLKNIVETGDEALAETLDLLGAKTPDGLAFTLDMNKVYVGPEMSLSMKLSNMVAETETAQASYQELQQAIAEANYASVTDLSLLGAKTPDGTAWMLDLNNVMVSPTKTLAQHLTTIVAESQGEYASVAELYEVVVTPEGGASAKTMLQTDVNGHIVSMVTTNDGQVGDITFNFDTFNIIHPGTDAPVFSVVGGVVKMSNVEIDTLKVGSVITENLAYNAVTEKKFFSDSYGGANGSTLGAPNTDTWAEFGDTGNKAKIVTDNIPVGTGISIRAYVNMKRTGDDNDRVWFRLKRTGPGGAVSYVGDTIQSGMSNYAMVFTYEWQDGVAEAGVYTYTLEYYRDQGGGYYYNCKLIADIGKR